MTVGLVERREVLLGHFRRGMAAGRGADSFTSLLEVIKKSA